MAHYEVIFHGQTSPTQKMALGKAAWITSVSLDETEIEEPDKVAKFSAACVRLAAAADELDLFVTDDLNRLNYEVLQKDPQTALALAKASGEQWKDKKRKDLAQVSNLKSTSSWNDIFKGVNKDLLIQIIEEHYVENTQFRLAVDYAASQRMSYITELALKDKLSVPAPADEMLRKFKTYVLEECAGVIALRLRGYEDAFYLAKLNQATAMIATTQFSLKQGEGKEQVNAILTAVNQKSLTFHTPSQYKLITRNSPPLSRASGKAAPLPLPHASSSMDRASNDGDKKALYEAFFGSKEIPLQTRVQMFEKLAGVPSVSTPTLAANGENFSTSPNHGTSIGDGSETFVPLPSSPPLQPPPKPEFVAFD